MSEIATFRLTSKDVDGFFMGQRFFLCKSGLREKVDVPREATEIWLVFHDEADPDRFKVSLNRHKYLLVDGSPEHDLTLAARDAARNLIRKSEKKALYVEVYYDDKPQPKRFVEE